MDGLLITLALLVLAIGLLVLVAEGYNRFLSRRPATGQGPPGTPPAADRSERSAGCKGAVDEQEHR